MKKKELLKNRVNWSLSIFLIAIFLFILWINFDIEKTFSIGFMIILSFLAGYTTCFTHHLYKSDKKNDNYENTSENK